MERSIKILDSEASSIDELLTELQAKKSQQEKELKEVKTVITILKRLQNKPDTEKRKAYIQFSAKRQQGIPTKSEEILKGGKSLHVNEIFEELSKMEVKTTVKSLTALLHSYAKRKKTFRFEGDNIYSLLENREA